MLTLASGMLCLFDPAKHRFQHWTQGAAARREFVFHAGRHLGVDFTLNEALLNELIQTATKRRGRDANGTFKLVKSDRFVVIEQKVEHVEHVRFAQELDKIASLRLQTNWMVVVVWLHELTKLLRYIKNPVSKGRPRLLARNFPPLIQASDGAVKEE